MVVEDVVDHMQCVVTLHLEVINSNRVQVNAPNIVQHKVSE